MIVSKRFGRNQKRKYRERIEELESQLRCEKMMHQGTKHQLHNAKQQALNFFIENSDLMKDAIMQMSHALGRALAPELALHKDAILKHIVREPLEFNYVGSDYREEAEILEAVIPLKSIHFRTMINPFRRLRA